MNYKRGSVKKKNQTLHSQPRQFIAFFSRPILMLGLLLSIPAFYLLLDGEQALTRLTGHALYFLVALLIFGDTYWQWKSHRLQHYYRDKIVLDMVIIIGCIVSAFPSHLHWSTLEWLLRLGLCILILARLGMLVLQTIKPSYLVKLIVLALLLLGSSGAGFYWLEPSVHNYADGVWLAFSTVATVGYGDLVPTTPASKILAVFIVLLGYAVFSIVTANIAALFIGEEEAGFERELHADIRALSLEVAALRRELRQHEIKLNSPKHDHGTHGTRAKEA